MKTEYAVMLICIAFLSGYGLSNVDHSRPKSVMERFQTWEPVDQQDFIIAAIQGKPKLKRAIAEDWCAINEETRRVCLNSTKYVGIK